MSIKNLIEQRNNKYDLRGNDILKRQMANCSTYGLKSWRFTAPKLEETQYPIHIEPDTIFQGSLLLSFVIY